MSLAAERSVASLPLADPLTKSLLEFNLLPSLTLHSTRAHRLPLSAAPHPRLPESARRLQHRDASAALLALLGDAAQPVTDTSQPALPLALASPALLERLAVSAGGLLLGRHIRRLILRKDVAAADEALGAEALDLAREGALHPGLADPASWLSGGMAPVARLLGAALLGRAWQDAPAPLRARADMKLPQGSDAPDARDASGLDALAARHLCLQLLGTFDPTWLSFFPSTTTPATR